MKLADFLFRGGQFCADYADVNNSGVVPREGNEAFGCPRSAKG
jgi:hypothetical protein